MCAQTSLQELELSLWKHSQTPLWDYFYSIHMHAHTCQLQARRRPSPDGGELHNSRICLWPLKVCLKGLSNSQRTSPKNTERRRHAIWSHSLWANPFPGRSQNSHITISRTDPPAPPPRPEPLRESRWGADQRQREDLIWQTQLLLASSFQDRALASCFLFNLFNRLKLRITSALFIIF